VILSHLSDIHQFYGEFQGVRIARKHINWYIDALTWNNVPLGKAFKTTFNQLLTASAQLRGITDLFDHSAENLVDVFAAKATGELQAA
jgi:tRNA-dihydrouridine synthase B